MLSNRQCNLIEIISSRGKLQQINHGNNKTRGNNNNNKPKKNQKKKNNKGLRVFGTSFVLFHLRFRLGTYILTILYYKNYIILLVYINLGLISSMQELKR